MRAEARREEAHDVGSGTQKLDGTAVRPEALERDVDGRNARVLENLGRESGAVGGKDELGALVE